MALDPATWLDKAQALDEGQSARTTHDCGPGTVLKVDHKRHGWGAWCHRCNDTGWVFRPQETLTQRLARARETEARESRIEADINPPTPANYDPQTWPVVPRVWLYKAGLSNATIRANGIYYHEPSKRVVLTVSIGGRVCYWQARGFDPERPKYLNPRDTAKPVFRAVPSRGLSGGPLVITEDILSAIRVGEVTEAWCIMGTSIPEPVLHTLVKSRRPVLVWLDPDGAGVKGARKFVPKLRSYGVDARSIRLTKDPKFHSREEITAVIRPDTAADAQVPR